ncbi:hypothetical protein [Saccharothrix sp. Mg75]|uniref:hypothetical protein n=1 Tax=Saccharothrix sp. Mg75 TaxID=3445357 RepID=UPI003EE9FDF3
MAVSDAVRRSGSLLLRALAVGGLATAAWLTCAGSASADAADHPDEVSTALDAVNTTVDEQHASAIEQLAAALPDHDPLAVSDLFPTVLDVPRHPVENPLFDLAQGGLTAQALTDSGLSAHSLTGTAALGPAQLGSSPLSAAPSFEVEAADEQPYDYDYDYEAEHSGFSGYTYSGRASNVMPVAAYEAKVAAKVAAREAAVSVPLAPPAAEPAAPEPAALEPVAVPRTDPWVASPIAAFQQVTATSPVAANAEVIWEAPEPSAPAPAPKHAPAAPSASSNSTTDSGGGHRGGVIASFTTESTPYPLTALAVERRNDRRSPGSIPGLPSTSPD